jgi:hypothetical protein
MKDNRVLLHAKIIAETYPMNLGGQCGTKFEQV